MPEEPPVQAQELVESVIRACEVLRAWQYEGELLRLRDVTTRVSLHKTTTHRLLQSLVAGGLIVRVGREQYRSTVRPLAAARRRFGFTAHAPDCAFSRMVFESVSRAAAERSVELVCVSGRCEAKTARNGEVAARERVDLVIEFPSHDDAGSLAAHRFLEAGTPLIAVETSHPGAVYFGANNYQAGLIGGRALGKWAMEHWRGQVDEILRLEERPAGSASNSRVAGMVDGLLDALPAAGAARAFTLEGKGCFEASLEAVRRHLQSNRARRCLVVASNDHSALGALRGFEECGRSEHCAIMGQFALPEAREELRHPGTRLVGSVAYFPERYGDELISLALSLLSGRPAPPALFVKHELVTAENVNRIYPPERIG